MKKNASIFGGLVSAMLLALNVYGEKTLLHVDFGQNPKPVSIHEKGVFDGPLPDNCRPDYPYWNHAVVNTQLLTENGRSFLRFKVDKFEPDVQFNFPRLDLAPGVYRLTINYRLLNRNLPLSIRQLPAPYRHYWDGNLSADNQSWQEKSFMITFNEKNDAAAIFFYPLGVCDLAALKLVKLEPADFVNAVTRPPVDCRNFFRNSRLPLGLQAGWNLGRDTADGMAGVDPAVIGPSGYPSLKLKSAEPVTIYSEPFQTAEPLKENHVSFAAKGSGQWTVSVLGSHSASVPLTTCTFTASSDWQTIDVTYMLKDKALTATALVVKITGTGTLNLDSFQAWAGAGERVYQSQGECEVALGLPSSECSENRLQFIDEPARFEYCVTGAFAGAALKFKAINAFGQEAELPSVPLAGKNKLEHGTLDFNAFSATPRGQFRIEAWVERNGQRISPYNELLLTRIARPVHGNSDAPDSPFGTHAMSSPQTLKLLKAAGVNWIRLHDAGTELTGWYHLEKEPGKWTFYDREIQRYRDRHLKLFAGLQTAPLWASLYQDSGRPSVDSYFDRYFPPQNQEAWANYVKTVTARYKGVIDDYFIWNEPWCELFWHTRYDNVKKVYPKSPDAPGEFAKLSIAAYKAAKESNPAVRISGFNSANEVAWSPAVLAAGAYPYCDMADYHFYTRSGQAEPGDQTQDIFNVAVGCLKKADPNFAKPVIMSEGQGNATGNSGGSGFGLYKHTLPWQNRDNPLTNAEQTCRFVIANLAAGCSKVFLYSTHGYCCLAIPSQFITITGQDGFPSVETAAYAALTGQLEDTKFVRLVKLNPQVNAYLFQGRTNAMAVISGSTDGLYQVPQQQGTTVRDLFGNQSNGSYQGHLLYVSASGSADSLAGHLTGAASAK